MNKHCADLADVNKLCVQNTTKKTCLCHFHFPRIAVLFDVQMKPYAAPCYLTTLKAMVCMVIVVLKRT